ncbi:IrmA family protein [Aeromonas hydrophila]|uniref:IrmA family protein n=1 Tax=Aeromonas hydrophila TaxID=644 RepID=UPI000AD24F58|nr:IrmA family protein [Aeromonas hydrophila]
MDIGQCPPKISATSQSQHTDTVYANQGVCAYHFSLDSGGGTDEFGQLYISLQFMTRGQSAGRVNSGG